MCGCGGGGGGDGRRRRRQSIVALPDGGPSARRFTGAARAHAREQRAVHVVAVATVFTAGAPRRQLTRARPRMGGASLGARAQPPWPPRTRPLRVRVTAGLGGVARTGVPGWRRGEGRGGGHGRRESRGTPPRAGSRSLRTAAADQSVNVLRAGRYVNGSRACV